MTTHHDDTRAAPPRRHRVTAAGVRAQDHLLRAADELFYREGVRSVGVDAVIKRAGVNKMALYRQFSSKDALVAEYLKRADERFFARFDASVAQHPGEPARQLNQYFADLAARASASDYRGCPFVNVAAEFPDAAHPARRFVTDNKHRLAARLETLAAAAGAADPAALAQALLLLIEGIYAASQTCGPGSGPVAAAPGIAARLIADACGTGNAAHAAPVR